MGRWTRRITCDHEWEEVFDSRLDVDAYNDGLNYEPYYKKCTKCGRTERINPGPAWYDILFLLFAIFIILLVAATICQRISGL